jgi:hypothetical protein
LRNLRRRKQAAQLVVVVAGSGELARERRLLNERHQPSLHY